MAIDFNAITRGQRTAQQDNRADLAARRAEETFAFNRDQRLQQLETQRWDQQAASYAAPLLGNMQQAADAGQDDLTFLINQRNAVMQDPNFQGFPPEVQQRVLKQLGEAAQITAQQRLAAGDPAAARELYKAFGWQNQIPEQDIAFRSGDVNQIVAAIDPGGKLLKPNQDGTYTYIPTGVVIPADRLAAVAQAGNGAQALPLISATIQQENARRTELETAQQQQQRQLYTQLAMNLGYTILQPDGTFANAQGQIYPLPPGLAPTGGTSAQPGVIQLPGAVPFDPNGPAASTPAGVPAALPSSLPGGVTVPVLPAQAQPEIAQGLTQLQTFYQQAQQQQEAVDQKRTVLAQLQRELDALPPLDMTGANPDSLSGGMGVVFSSPQNAERVRVGQQLTNLQREIVQAEADRKLIADQQIPALEQQLGAAAPAAWGQQLMQELVASNATPEAAKATVRQSPAMAGNYLRALTMRLQELRGQPGTEKEASELISARANLVAALAEARPAKAPAARSNGNSGGGGGR